MIEEEPPVGLGSGGNDMVDGHGLGKDRNNLKLGGFANSMLLKLMHGARL